MGAFVYHGNVEILAKEVAEAQDVLNARYKELLGEERFRKLEEASQRFLSPEVYFDAIEQVNRIFEHGALPEKITSDETPSKFIMAVQCDSTIFPNGRIKDNRAKVGIGFYVSEKSFKHSGARAFTDRIIATYVHEFNHFASFVLQKTPFVVAHTYLLQDLPPMRRVSDVSGLAARLSLNSKLSPDEKKLVMIRAATAYAIDDVQERANRILDKNVLESISINAPVEWRNQHRQFRPAVSYDPPVLMALPVTGDPFKDLTDKDAINQFIEWEKYSGPVIPHPAIETLLQSFKELDVEVLPLYELKGQHEKAYNEYREGQRRKEELKRYSRKEKRRKRR